MAKAFIILFRGINVGGRNILPMKELVGLLQKQGFEDVQTCIQSGNVVCRGPHKPDGKISQAIKRQFGFEPQVMVLTPKELQTAITNNPYAAKEGKTVHFFLCREKPKVAVIKQLADYQSSTEQFTCNGKTVYLWAPDGIGRSKLVAKMDKSLGTTVTARNLNTINKLFAMVNT